MSNSLGLRCLLQSIPRHRSTVSPGHRNSLLPPLSSRQPVSSHHAGYPILPRRRPVVVQSTASTFLLLSGPLPYLTPHSPWWTPMLVAVQTPPSVYYCLRRPQLPPATLQQSPTLSNHHPDHPILPRRRLVVVHSTASTLLLLSGPPLYLIPPGGHRCLLQSRPRHRSTIAPGHRNSLLPPSNSRQPFSNHHLVHPILPRRRPVVVHSIASTFLLLSGPPLDYK
ncbi:uncharacterized protein LOC110021717 [Phalaenopsis equestris]|uniref:uncharacterized protein LOC110021717 n=1 Tax=Phalaenopsis equestris TaxID=78828 RepID=UPI0009E3816E|nr:uncharacterized protein LOC110021717 [Phalaenopsis equestris]